MLRFLVTPRAMALHVALLACVVAFGALAWWQWDRAHRGSVDVASLPAIPVQDVSAVGAPDIAAGAAGRTVTASGTYVTDPALLVVPVDGAAGPVRILTPLRLDDGTVVAVVRGTAPDASSARQVPTPTGTVDVVGRLQPSDDLADPALAAARADEGQLVGIATSELVGVLGRDLHPGWVAASAETPSPSQAPPRLSDADLYLPESGLQLRNAAYTLQWILFAGFVVFVYRRFLLDAWRSNRAALSDGEPANPHLTKETA